MGLPRSRPSHHLPLAETFVRARDALRPGGIFVALDVVDERTLLGVTRSLAAFPASALGRLVTTGRLRPPPEVRAAWEAHAVSDRFAKVAEVRRIAAEILPGASVRRHFFWRYSLVWRRPDPDLLA